MLTGEESVDYWPRHPRPVSGLVRHGQQTTEYRQQTTGDRQQTTEDRQQATDNTLPTTDNRQHFIFSNVMSQFTLHLQEHFIVSAGWSRLSV